MKKLFILSVAGLLCLPAFAAKDAKKWFGIGIGLVKAVSDAVAPKEQPAATPANAVAPAGDIQPLGAPAALRDGAYVAPAQTPWSAAPAAAAAVPAAPAAKTAAPTAAAVKAPAASAAKTTAPAAAASSSETPAIAPVKAPWSR